MVKLDDGSFLIGVDNGNQLIKTGGGLIFDNGILQMGVEPPTKQQTLFIDENYYKIGERRAGLIKNIMQDERNLLLTYAAIAMELRAQNITKAKVRLAVGLPYANYGHDKQPMIDYFAKKKKIHFTYEGQEYRFTIEDVMVFPQCYAAIAPRLMNMKGEYLIVDIGSKTVDFVKLKDGVPKEGQSSSIEKAMISTMKQIQMAIQKQFGEEVPEEEILRHILDEEALVPKYKKVIESMLVQFMDEVESVLKEYGHDLDFVQTIYVGGGAVVAKKYSRRYRYQTACDCDICANAKGYEYLARQLLKRRGISHV